MEKIICQRTSKNLNVSNSGEVFKNTFKFLNKNNVYYIQLNSQSLLHPKINIITTIFSSDNELEASLQYRQIEKCCN